NVNDALRQHFAYDRVFGGVRAEVRPRDVVDEVAAYKNRFGDSRHADSQVNTGTFASAIRAGGTRKEKRPALDITNVDRGLIDEMKLPIAIHARAEFSNKARERRIRGESADKRRGARADRIRRGIIESRADAVRRAIDSIIITGKAIVGGE